MEPTSLLDPPPSFPLRLGIRVALLFLLLGLLLVGFCVSTHRTGEVLLDGLVEAGLADWSVP